ncbi:MAG: hypothetical protein WC444_02125 [Candidatus Paceibacterota bacterium]
MIEPELQAHLESIEKEIIAFRNESNGLASTFTRGVVHGAGYVIGVVLIIIVIGWILNIVGVIPALNTQVSEFRAALDRIGGPVK